MRQDVGSFTTNSFHESHFVSVQNEMALMTENLLRLVGEDPKRQGLLKTPQRFSKALSFLTSGHDVNIKQLVGDALFDKEGSELVFIKNIEFYSLCEHHMLPFFGKVHVAYVPAGKVIGLSKIPRIVDAFSRRLQVQERLTKEIAQALESVLKPKGVAVIVEASHMCMMMRGIEKQGSTTLTKSMRGEFRHHDGLRSELLSFLNK